MRKIHVLLLTLVLGLMSCQEEGFKLYSPGDDSYVVFQNPETDTIVFSFSAKGVSEYNQPLVFCLSGTIESEGGKAKSYAISIVDSLTTMNKSYVTIPANLIFEPWKALDTVFVHLKRYADLEVEDANGNKKEVFLCLELCGNDELQLGDRDYRRVILKISDDLVQPEWWSGAYQTHFFGKYSKKKFKLLIQVAQPDLSVIPSLQTAQEWVLKLKRYLEAQNPQILDEDGEPMLSTIPAEG